MPDLNEHGDDYEWTPELETGMPLLPCQVPLGGFRLIDNDDGEIVIEAIVFPNLTIRFDCSGPVRFGAHAMTTPAYARRSLTESMPDRKAHADECPCELHSSTTFEYIDPATAWG